MNPLDPACANPWCDIPLPEFTHAEDDMTWDWFSGPGQKRDDLARGYLEKLYHWLVGVRDEASLRAQPNWPPRRLPFP